MDVPEFWDYFAPQAVSPNALLDQRLEETTPMPPFSPLCSSDLETMLNSLFPGDEPFQNHMDYMDTTGCTVDNDHDMILSYDSLERIREASQEYDNQILPNDNSQNCQSNNFTSNSVLDTLEQLLASSFAINQPNSSSSFSSDTSDASDASEASEASDSSDSSIQTEINTTSYSTQNSNELSDGSKDVETWPPQLRRPYTDHNSNNLPPMDPGFKPTLSLCTDTSIVEEPWKPNVTMKILSTYYTPLSLKSEFLATKTALDEFQSLALKEVVAAFHDVALRNNITHKLGQNYYPDSCPRTLVNTCRKVRAYRRLLDDDKVTLLSSVFFDVIAMKSVLTYDHLTDSWSCSGIRVDRRDVYRLDSFLHNGIARVIETFPDRWRKDLTVAALIYLIIIFNPDLPNLKFSESIRLEQYTYIYLLQRYLESACEFEYEASDYLYRLMAKIEEIQSLRQNMRNVFEIVSVNFPLSGRITNLVQCND